MTIRIRQIIFILSICTGYYTYGQNPAQIAYRITEKDLIPEGITYSSYTNKFYISSIHKTKIIQVDAKTGDFSDFITSDLLNISFLGMIVDHAQKVLWACGNKHKKSVVARFDLNTGKLLKLYSHSDTVKNIFNDLVEDDKGNVYFTNTNDQTIYKIDPIKDTITEFFRSPEIIYPNGITISPDNKYLYVASNDKGIRVLDIDKRKIVNEVDSVIISTGLDGIKYYKGSIIGLQNEVKSRSEVKIAQYFLNKEGTQITDVKILVQNHPNFDIPTTFVLVNDCLYCLANSQIANINFETNEIRSYKALDDVLVLKYKLK